MAITDVAKAEFYLSKISYFRLSAYWYRFRKKTGSVVENEFKAGTTFKSVIELYVFDKRLRLLVMDALERIEVAIRTDITLQIAAGNPSAHLDTSNFDPKFTKPGTKGHSRHDTLVAIINKEAKLSNDAFMDHFRRNYSQYDLPLWIAIELLSFGSLSVLFGGLKHQHKAAIASRYGLPKNKHMINGLHMLTDVRNRCAHHARLWNRPLVNQLPPFRPNEVPSLEHILDYNRLYSALAFIAHLMAVIAPNSTWRHRLRALIQSFPVGPHMAISEAGFHQGWEDETIWL